jgi:hypothetical protein
MTFARKSVKAGLDADDTRKQRANKGVELRKAKKEEGLLKRRNMVTVDPGLLDGEDAAPPPTQGELGTCAVTALGFVTRNGPPEEFDECLNAVRKLRKLLSIPHCPPIDDVIEANLVPAFVTMLAHPNDQLQFEAAWCLTNIASGTAEQCEIVVSQNAVPSLVNLLASPAIHVSEQAVWALGNIAGDCAQMRDIVLKAGAMERVLALVEVHPPPTLCPSLHAGWRAMKCPSPLLCCFLTTDFAARAPFTVDGDDGPDGAPPQRYVGPIELGARQAPGAHGVCAARCTDARTAAHARGRRAPD